MDPTPKSLRPGLVFALTLLVGPSQALATEPPPTAFSSAATTASATAGITSIRLERNCFGCTTGSVLMLSRDGRASYTVTGNARSGTADKTSTGLIAADEFEHLARLAVSNDFFAMKDSYEDAETRDGAWLTTTIARDGKDKQVFRREDAGPPTLGAFEAGVEAAKARIRFNP